MAIMIGIGVGMLTILMGILTWAKLSACTEPISARVVDYGDWGDSDGREYRPIVEYTHGGETYRHPIVVEAGKACSWKLEEVKQAYPEGTTVTVYINPEKPKFSTVDPGRDRNDALVFIGIGFLLILLLAGR